MIFPHFFWLLDIASSKTLWFTDKDNILENYYIMNNETLCGSTPKTDQVHKPPRRRLQIQFTDRNPPNQNFTEPLLWDGSQTGDTPTPSRLEALTFTQHDLPLLPKNGTEFKCTLQPKSETKTPRITVVLAQRKLYSQSNQPGTLAATIS